jgi:transposase
MNFGAHSSSGQILLGAVHAEPPAGEVVKLPEAKRGFVLFPRRWVVERSVAWLARFRRLARDYERLPETLASLHFIAFAYLLLHRTVSLFTSS